MPLFACLIPRETVSGTVESLCVPVCVCLCLCLFHYHTSYSVNYMYLFVHSPCHMHVVVQEVWAECRPVPSPTVC